MYKTWNIFQKTWNIIAGKLAIDYQLTKKVSILNDDQTFCSGSSPIDLLKSPNDVEGGHVEVLPDFDVGAGELAVRLGRVHHAVVEGERAGLALAGDAGGVPGLYKREKKTIKGMLCEIVHLRDC